MTRGMGSLRSFEATIAAITMIVVCACVPLSTSARADPSERTLSHLLLLEVAGNEDDTFIGGAYRIRVMKSPNLGVQASFAGRTSTNAFLQQIGPRLFIQRYEERYLGALGVDYVRLAGKHGGLFAGAAAGYTFADYDGTKQQPEEGLTPVIQLGILAQFGGERTQGQFRVGYQYANLRVVASNRFLFAAGVHFL